VPGAGSRWVMLTLVTVSAVALAVLLVHVDGSWVGLHHHDFHHQRLSGSG
jgi:hypothetical protein